MLGFETGGVNAAVTKTAKITYLVRDPPTHRGFRAQRF